MSYRVSCYISVEQLTYLIVSEPYSGWFVGMQSVFQGDFVGDGVLRAFSTRIILVEEYCNTVYAKAFNRRVLDRSGRCPFQLLSTRSLYGVERKSTLVLIPKHSLLICTKFKVGSRQLFVKNERTRRLTRPSCLFRRLLAQFGGSARSEV